MVGTIIGAELCLAGYRVFHPLTEANGGILRVSVVAGQFTVVASRLLTARASGDPGALAPPDRTRVLIYMIDTFGRRQTLDVVPFEVFDGSESLSIDDVAQVTLVSQTASYTIVVAAAQGAPGPSNIPAAQISDGGDIGRKLLQAADAAAARALLSLTSFHRAVVQDANDAVQIADTYVGFTSLSAPRTVTLPLAISYPPGQPLWIADEKGSCSTDHPIVVAGAGGDVIAGQPNVSLASPYQKLALHSNGTNLWIF